MDVASSRLLFRQMLRITTLKSGFRKAYTKGLTKEATAIMQYEIVRKTRYNIETTEENVGGCHINYRHPRK